jgi:hypothetical protein
MSLPKGLRRWLARVARPRAHTLERFLFLQLARCRCQVAGTSVRNWIKFRRQSQARLTAVGGATVARIRRPLTPQADVAASAGQS